MSKSKLFNEVKLSKNNATNKYEECSRGKKKLNNIAKKCDLVRVKAGIHYPSDGKLAKDMVYFLIRFNLI